jgi:outer membrane lipoprotein-sorting protein
MIRRLSLLLVCLSFAGSALAGPKEDLHAAFSKFLAQSSFKGSVTSDLNGRSFHSTVEFQAPDRYRIARDGQPPSVVIGNDMYIVINGRSMKMAMPIGNMIGQYRDSDMVTRIESSLNAEDLGLDTVNGEPAHKYRYTISQPHPSTTIVWVSIKSGLPVQLQSSGAMMGKTVNSTVNYGNYSDPSIKITAPN